MNVGATSVFVPLLALVALVGVFAGRWHGRGELSSVEEWGLAGRRFGTLIAWFLIGGDFYTAYTLIAVPALVFGVGASGFFALVYTIIVYPFVFLVMPRLWEVCKRHNYVTLADFTQGRYGSHWLALAVAFTGILATMPYIALQLVGIEVAIAALGFAHTGGPLIAAFALLAIWDYSSGLRAPASVALIKDTMVYAFVIVAVIWIPAKLGGYGHIFAAAGKALAARTTPGHLILPHGQYLAFATLALGSALAAFLYPHMTTSVLSARSSQVIRRNAVLLPAYTFLLGLIALLGYMAIAGGVTVASNNDVVPALLLKLLPGWFAGFCFAAIAIGGLVPAAIMAIAASSLFTRSIVRRYFKPDLKPRSETAVSKLVSLLIKLGALAMVLWGRPAYMINFQLLGSIWILQTLPAVMLGLYRLRLHPVALLSGWAAGMASGTAMAWFQGTTYPLRVFGATYSAYSAIYALILNLVVLGLLSALFCGRPVPTGETSPADFEDLVIAAS